MAFTNAQLQARHRDRVRVRLTLAALVEAFRDHVRQETEEAGGDPTSPKARDEGLRRMLGSPEGMVIAMAFLETAAGCGEWR